MAIIPHKIELKYNNKTTQKLKNEISSEFTVVFFENIISYFRQIVLNFYFYCCLFAVHNDYVPCGESYAYNILILMHSLPPSSLRLLVPFPLAKDLT